MLRPAVEDRTGNRRSTAGPDGVDPLEEFTLLLRLERIGQGKDQFSVVAIDGRELGLAQSCGTTGDRLEHRLHVGRRATDDLQHLGGRGLLLQRLAEIGRALAKFVEQPRVLDGDDSLVGEIRDQLDLLIGEWLHLRAPQVDHSNWHPFAQKRDAQPRSKASNLLGGAERVFRIGQDIVNANCTTLDHDASSKGPPARRNRR